MVGSFIENSILTVIEIQYKLHILGNLLRAKLCGGGGEEEWEMPQNHFQNGCFPLIQVSSTSMKLFAFSSKASKLISSRIQE